METNGSILLSRFYMALKMQTISPNTKINSKSKTLYTNSKYHCACVHTFLSRKQILLY